MKATEMKAPAMPKFAAVSNVWSFIRTATVSNKLFFGITGAAAAYLGCILSADVVMYAGALLALLSVKPIEKKGGQK